MSNDPLPPPEAPPERRDFFIIHNPDHVPIVRYNIVHSVVDNGLLVLNDDDGRMSAFVLANIIFFDSEPS